MTEQPDRPEVDDPRVLALAKARQQIAYESPFNFVCPPWDGLTEQEQHLSLLDARNYLRAALKAGLVAEPAAVPAPATDGAAPVCKFDEGCHRVVPCEPGCGTPWSTTDRATLRDRIAAALLARIKWATVSKDRRDDALTSLLAANEFDLADAVLPVLTADADRAAVLREAADFYDRLLADMGAAVECDPHYWQAIRRVTVELRRMADETQQPEAAEGPAIPRAAALREAVTAMEELMADGEHEPGVLVERVREMADEAAAVQQPKEARPPTAYSDGKGRTYCLPCAPTVGADVPLTINDVDHWDLCPSCGRHVVDVARATEQPKEA